MQMTALTLTGSMLQTSTKLDKFTLLTSSSGMQIQHWYKSIFHNK